MPQGYLLKAIKAVVCGVGAIRCEEAATPVNALSLGVVLAAGHGCWGPHSHGCHCPETHLQGVAWPAERGNRSRRPLVHFHGKGLV